MRYTVKFSKSGINQYKDIFFNENNELQTKEIKASYQKEAVDLSGCSSIEEVITLLSEYSYNKKAEIWRIEGLEPNFYANKDVYLNDIEESQEALVKILSKFYEKNIVPLLPHKNSRKEIEIHKNYNAINYLSYRILYNLGLTKYYDFQSESGYGGENYFLTLKDKIE